MFPKEFTLDWRGETLRGELHTYPHIGNPAIQLYDEDGLPYATASVNPAHPLPAGLIAIKDYAENNSLLTALEEAGIVAHTDQVVAVGHTCAYLCRVLI